MAKWQERDEYDNFFQKYDASLVKDAVRPVVFEEVRQQVDAEMRVLLANLKVRGASHCGQVGGQDLLFGNSSLLAYPHFFGSAKLY